MTQEIPNKKLKEYVEKKVRETIKKYLMLSKTDKIAVAVSGGKDSTVCLYILKKLGYDVEGINLDPSIGEYTDQNIKNLKTVCKKNNIKLTILSFKKEFGMTLKEIQDKLKEKGHNNSSCMICGILKRYLLNKYAKKKKFNAVVTGHNLDDEAQAFMMNIFRNDTKLAKSQGPISGSSNSSKFVKRVKPLYWISEEEVKRYSKIMKFTVYYGICPLSKEAYRRTYRKILDDFEKNHPAVKYNLLRFHERLILPLKKEIEFEEINSCEKCGEPASNKMCRACNILKDMNT
ncbi:MAG: TIGR00269 family protein [Nanoarchaeota archaeon]|nr:TIGR00269 family protein [Nanoarchaeota archaeon]MBU1030395.1 TIGR00269 family protein [Nanoarchaeota archaeon]MBU1850017.1 TIGR00269 family protein [Nanoarchaeota archaeon]